MTMTDEEFLIDNPEISQADLDEQDRRMTIAKTRILEFCDSLIAEGELSMADVCFGLDEANNNLWEAMANPVCDDDGPPADWIPPPVDPNADVAF